MAKEKIVLWPVVKSKVKTVTAGDRFISEVDLPKKMLIKYKEFQRQVEDIAGFGAKIAFSLPDDDDGSVENGMWIFKAVLPPDVDVVFDDLALVKKKLGDPHINMTAVRGGGFAITVRF